MAAAIPAAIGVGSSLIGGIKGKGAAGREEKLRMEQLKQLQPLINAQIQGLQFGLGQAKDLYPQAISGLKDIFGQAGGMRDAALTDYRKLLDDALGKSNELYSSGRGLMAKGEGMLPASQRYLEGAGVGLEDLQKFYRPFMFDGQRAIDRFLPGAQQIQNLFGSELADVNKGFEANRRNLQFAPRGGGQGESFNRLDAERQGGISRVYSDAKKSLLGLNLQNAFQGAGGESSRLAQLIQLGSTQGQLGLGTIGQGLNTIGTGTSLLGTGGGLAQGAFGQGLQSEGLRLGASQGLGSLGQGALDIGTRGAGNIYDLYNQQANRSYGSSPPTSSGKGLGGFLVDLFSDKGVQGKVGDIFSRRPKGFSGYDF